MPLKPIAALSLARISAHRPMHDAPRVALYLVSHPLVLLSTAFALAASMISAALLEDYFVGPTGTLIYFFLVVPAGFLIHHITSPCTFSQESLLAKVAHEDAGAGPYVRSWIAPNRTPSLTEFRLVQTYLRDRGFLSSVDAGVQAPLYVARHLAGERSPASSDDERT